MRLSKLTAILLLVAVVGCTDNPFDSSGTNMAVRETGQNKLRHAQLLGHSGSAVAGKGADAEPAHVFIGLREHDEDGQPREIDSYGVTRRILQEYGVTRRVLQEYGVTRRVLQEYGISHGVLDSYSLVLSEVDPLGIPRTELQAVDYDITPAFMDAMGVDRDEREERGVSDQVLDEYGVTRRVLQEYGISVEDYLEALAGWERTVKLKARIDSARPGLFVSLGLLPLADFLEEASADDDIDIVEIDVEIDPAPMGTITESAGGSELTPWGIADIGGGMGDGGTTHVFLVDSGVEHADLNVVERTDFSEIYKDRGEETWDDTNAIERPVGALISTAGTLLNGLLDGGSKPSSRDDGSGDVTGHGTHLAGIIGAQANGKLVKGATPGAAIHSLRVMNERGQSDIATVVAALDYIADVKLANPQWNMVVNLSLGMNLGSTSYNVLDEAVRKLTRMGVTAVVSAGNDGADASMYSPAHVAEAITVGSYNQSKRFSSFSNWGGVVDVLAPGEFIVSLSSQPGDVDRNVGLVESGTSQAAAHVTGLVAHYLNSHSLARPEDVRNALVRGARAEIGKVPGGTTDRALYLDTTPQSSLLGGLLGGRRGR